MADSKTPTLKSRWQKSVKKTINTNRFKSIGARKKASTKGVRRDQSRSRRQSTSFQVDEQYVDSLHNQILRRNNRGESDEESIPTGNETKKGGLAPLETLLDVLGEHSVKELRTNKVIDLSDPSYQINTSTLHEIHYISGGGRNRKAMDTVTDMFLSFNHIDTLLPLVLVTPQDTNKKGSKNNQSEGRHRQEEVRGFQHLEVIMADHNFIRWMCPGHRNQYNYHAWPYEMTRLLHVDLSYNRLDAIPDLIFMPNLQILNLAHNRIMIESIPNLDYGNQLQVLDLSENRLGWSPRTFVEDVKSHFRCCVQLRRLCLDRNPFISELENYYQFVVKIFYSNNIDSSSDDDDEIIIIQDGEAEARGTTAGVHQSGRAGRNRRRDQLARDRRKERRKRVRATSERSCLNFVDHHQVTEKSIFDWRHVELGEEQLYATEFHMGHEDGYSEQGRGGQHKWTNHSLYGGNNAGDASDDDSAAWTLDKFDFSKHGFEDDEIPTLEDIRKEIEFCLKTPKETAVLLRKIFVWIQQIMEFGEDEHWQLLKGLLSKRKSPLIFAKVENILMNFHLLMERQTDLTVPILQCIAVLTGINAFGIGTQCLEFLHYLINSHDARFKRSVHLVLHQHVLPYVINRNEVKRSNRMLSTIAGLQKEDGGLDDFLSELIDPIKTWLTDASVVLDDKIAPIFSQLCRIPNIANSCGQDIAEYVVRELATVSKDNSNSVYLSLLVSVTGISTHNLDEVGNHETVVDDPYHMSRYFALNDVHKDCVYRLEYTLAHSPTSWTPLINEEVTTLLHCLSSLCQSPFVALSIINSQLHLLRLIFRITNKAVEFATHVFPTTVAACFNLLLIFLVSNSFCFFFFFFFFILFVSC